MITCPQCKGQNALVIDSRNSPDGRRRRLRCPCGAAFTTAEMLVDESMYHNRRETSLNALKRAVMRDAAPIESFTTRQLLEELLRRETT